MRREELLHEMGLSPIWRLRNTTDASDTGAEAAGAAVETEATPQSAEAAGRAMAVAPAAPAYVEASSSAPAVTAVSTPAGVGSMDWPELEQAVAQCRACGLCERRKQAVLGVGDRHPDWMFIGEGPGADEDEQGEPFVGQAGKLLDAMLGAIDLARGRGVYIGNAVKCRPPGNRTPEAGEMAACKPYLERQIDLLQPKLIVLLGRAAVHTILA
ncbi:MAG: uracil-DNA glycosylase, partial [Betaproteobacteria bacterium]|nr:uracil-DNA glycosylase [Betaproteobacteria bacterium]